MDVMGVQEVARTAGVTKQVVANWIMRGTMPPPDATLACGSIWDGPTVRTWINERRQRLTPTPTADHD